MKRLGLEFRGLGFRGLGSFLKCNDDFENGMQHSKTVNERDRRAYIENGILKIRTVRNEDDGDEEVPRCIAVGVITAKPVASWKPLINARKIKLLSFKVAPSS